MARTESRPRARSDRKPNAGDSTCTRGSVRQRARSTASLEMAVRGVWPLMLATAGCTRAYYHDYADNDVYRILKERLFDWRWRVPERPVEAAAASREWPT